MPPKKISSGEPNTLNLAVNISPKIVLRGRSGAATGQKNVIVQKEEKKSKPRKPYKAPLFFPIAAFNSLRLLILLSIWGEEEEPVSISHSCHLSPLISPPSPVASPLSQISPLSSLKARLPQVTAGELLRRGPPEMRVQDPKAGRRLLYPLEKCSWYYLYRGRPQYLRFLEDTSLMAEDQVTI